MFATLAQAETPRFSNEWWLTVGVSLGLILLFAVIVNVLARRYVRRLEDRAAMLAEGTEREKLRQARRRATVAKLLLDTFQIVVWSVVVMIILTSLGVNLGPLLATAGIAGCRAWIRRANHREGHALRVLHPGRESVRRG